MSEKLFAEALKHIPAERLVISSDCGMGREGMGRRGGIAERRRANNGRKEEIDLTLRLGSHEMRPLIATVTPVWQKRRNRKEGLSFLIFKLWSASEA